MPMYFRLVPIKWFNVWTNRNEIMGNFHLSIVTLELYPQHRSQYEQWETLEIYVLLNISEIFGEYSRLHALRLIFWRGSSPAVPLSLRHWVDLWKCSTCISPAAADPVDLSQEHNALPYVSWLGVDQQRLNPEVERLFASQCEPLEYVPHALCNITELCQIGHWVNEWIFSISISNNFYWETTISNFNSRTKTKGVVTLVMAANNKGREDP